MTYRYAPLHSGRPVWQYHSVDGSWQYSAEFGTAPNDADTERRIIARGSRLSRRTE